MPAMHDTNPTWRAATRAWYTVPEVGDVGTDHVPSVELTSLPIETNDEDSRRWSVTFRFATHLAADDDTVPLKSFIPCAMSLNVGIVVMRTEKAAVHLFAPSSVGWMAAT